MKQIVISFLLIQAIGFSALRADINHDGRVDLADLAILASEWLQEDRSVGMRLGENNTVGWFDSEIGWTITDELNDISIAAGIALFSIPEGGGASMERLLAGLEVGEIYRFAFDVADIEGDLPESEAYGAFCGHNVLFNTAGSYYADIVYDGIGHVIFYCTGFDPEASIRLTNLSICKIYRSVSGNEELSEAWGW
jgi:hypothetical protein